MDQELIKYLQEMEGRLDRRFVDLEQRFVDLDGRLDRRFVDLEQRFVNLDGRLVDLEQRVTSRIEERIETVETRLLTEFHKWAATYEPRVRGVSAAVRTFDERLDALEERVRDLERGK